MSIDNILGTVYNKLNKSNKATQTKYWKSNKESRGKDNVNE